MLAVPDEPHGDVPGRPSWGAIADAVGNYLLVFAFVPPLAVLPGWALAELNNPVNLHDRIVGVFLPARGLLALLDAFSAGLAQRALAGILTGTVLSALPLAHRPVSRPRRAAAGAVGGMLGAALSLLVLPLLPEDVAAYGGGPMLALVSGALCGLLGAPGAYRALAGSGASDPTLVAAAR
jgi:hypothetical protein